jgi:hypothetical protein
MSTTDESFIVFTHFFGELSVVAAGDKDFCKDIIKNYEDAPEEAFMRRVTSSQAVYDATEEATPH